MIAMEDLRPRGTVEIVCRCGVSFWVDALHAGLPMPANAAVKRARDEFKTAHGREPVESDELMEVAEQAERYNRGVRLLCPDCSPTIFEKAL